MADVSEKGHGTSVKITDGTFVGMTGELLTLAQARAYWQEHGGTEPYSREWPGLVYVVVTIDHCPVLVILEAWQVAPAP